MNKMMDLVSFFDKKQGLLIIFMNLQMKARLSKIA